MPRTLTLSRASVPAANAPAYLQTLGRLAAISAGRGRRLWLFRSSAQPDLYLECSESGAPEQHRTVARLPNDEQELEARLRQLASYEPGAWDAWEEVAF